MPTNDIQLEFKVEVALHIGVAPNEELPDGGHYLGRQGANLIGRYRHIAPAQQSLPLLLHEGAHDAFQFALLLLVVRHEYHTHGIVTGLLRLNAQPLHLLAEEIVRHLNQNARAVARLRVRPLRTSMFQVAQHLEPLLQDVVRLRAFDIGNKSHPAGIMLEVRVVQSLLC